MTQNLLITSINPGVGKTTFTFALALKFRQMGKKVGYFKPITDRTEDTDALDAKKLLDMAEDISVICPTLVSAFEYDMTKVQREEIITKIREAFNVLKSNYDFLIIESCRKINYLSYLNLSAKDLAKELEAKVLILTEGREIEDIDRILLGQNFFESAKIDVVGAVMSLVPDQLFSHFKTVITPSLKDKFGIEVLGLIPNRGTLVAPTVEEVASSLNAKILAGKNFTNKLVENYIVGAMQPEAALKYFRRSINKAVVTGGDRPQVVLAAMETSTSAIILTGGILPPARVLSSAEEKEIPILLVQNDTFSTIQMVSDNPVYGKIHVEQADKIEEWSKILEEVDCNKIIEKLG